MKAALLVAGLAATVGCFTHDTIIESRGVVGTAKLTELFVISEVGSKGELKGAGFEKALVETGRACGLRIAVSMVQRLELDPGAHEDRMKAFGADRVLTVGITSVTWKNDRIDVARYDARIYQREPKQVVWRADVQLKIDWRMSGNAGETLATALLRKLRSDSMIDRCNGLASNAER
jgi:hypothetical protein